MKMKIRIKNPIIGVPITFMDKYNPEQFEIIGHENDINGNGVRAEIWDKFVIN